MRKYEHIINYVFRITRSVFKKNLFDVQNHKFNDINDFTFLQIMKRSYDNNIIYYKADLPKTNECHLATAVNKDHSIQRIPSTIHKLIIQIFRFLVQSKFVFRNQILLSWSKSIFKDYNDLKCPSWTNALRFCMHTIWLKVFWILQSADI